MSIKKFESSDNSIVRGSRSSDQERTRRVGQNVTKPINAIGLRLQGRRGVLSVIAAGMLLAAGPASAERLRLLHTNDIHSHLVPFVTLKGDTVGGAARLATLIRQEEAAEPNHLYLDAGDLFQGTPFYNFFRGEAELRVMSALGCDAMALGNHELDNGPVNFLTQVRDHATFPILCANVLIPRRMRDMVESGRAASDSSQLDSGEETGPRNANGAAEEYSVPIGLPWTLLHAGNIRVGVIGVTTETLPAIVTANNLRDVTVEPVVDHVRQLIPDLRARSDVVVVLSHCGLRADSLLATSVSGIDVVVSAHDHQKLNQPILVSNPETRNGIGGTILVETGHSGENLGCLDLDIEGGRIAAWHDTLLRVTGAKPPDSLVASIIAGYERQVGDRVKEVVALAAAPLSSDSVLAGETALGNLVTDLIRESAGTDIAVQNGGGIRTSINKGEIRLGDLFQLLPFDNTIVTVSLTGEQLTALCMESVAKRGTGGFLQISGMSFDVADGRPVTIRVRGEGLEMSRKYSLATNNFTAAGGDGWTIFRQGSDYRDTGVVLRDAIMRALKERGTVDPRVEGRIRFLQ